MIENPPYDIGFGTFSLKGEHGVEIISEAIEAGYRHIDTARMYENEPEVGEAINQSTIDREALFIATKIDHFTEQDPTEEYLRQGVRESKEKLGIETIDLLYHHWRRKPAFIHTVLPVFEELLHQGHVARIGVSNYTIEDLRTAFDICEEPIYVNQVEMHPLLQQTELLRFLREHDMMLVAYSPLAQGRVFDVPVIQELADKHNCSAAAVSLAWLHQKENVVPIPRTSSKRHLVENLEARTVSLDPEDIERIEGIEQTHRCEDPAWMKW